MDRIQQQPGTERQIINGFCIGLVLLFLPFYAFYVRSLPVSLATVLCLIILLFALPLLKHRRFTTAKDVMLIGFFYQVSALALFWFPREANFNYFYYIVAPIVFFILDFRLRTERRMIIFSCALAMLLLIFSEVSDIPEPGYRGTITLLENTVRRWIFLPADTGYRQVYEYQ